MRSGDFESGFFNLAYSVACAFVAGQPLSAVLKDSENVAYHLRQYRMDVVLNVFDSLYQLIKCLAGCFEDPLAWVTHTEANFDPSDSLFDKTLSYVYCNKHMYGMLAAFYMRNVELAECMRKRLEILLPLVGPNFVIVTVPVFFTGLVASAMYRRTHKRSYRTMAYCALRKMKRMVEKTGLNLLHRYYIMEAECAATFPASSKPCFGLSEEIVPQRVRRLFDRAIAAASKAGFMHDAALAKELAGEYFLRMGDISWAQHYLQASCDLYQSWGADAKVRQLESSYHELIGHTSGSRNIVMGTLRKSTVQMTKHTIRMHSRAGLVSRSLSSDSLSTRD